MSIREFGLESLYMQIQTIRNGKTRFYRKKYSHYLNDLHGRISQVRPVNFRTL